MKAILIKAALLLLIIAPGIFAEAQFIALPDSNLGKWISWNYPYTPCLTGNAQTGWFLDTTCSLGSNRGQTLSVTNYNISNIQGLQYFTGYQYLDLSGNKLKKIPYQFIDRCEKMILDNNLIDTLDLNLLALHTLNSNYGFRLYCNNNKIVKVVPDTGTFNLPSVYDLSINNNLIDTLPKLTGKYGSGYNDFTLEARHNHLHGSYDASYCFVVDVGANQLTSLKFGNCNRGLYCDSNQITSLDFVNTHDIMEFSAILKGAYNNMVSLFPSGGAYKFYYVDCSHNHITSLPSTFGTLDCSYNNLSYLPPLVGGGGSYGDNISLDCSHNPLLTCLPAIPAAGLYLNAASTAIHCVPNRFPFGSYSGPTSVSSFPLCELLSTTTCTSYTSMEGLLYHDSLGTCVINSAEARVKHYPVDIYKNGNLSQRAFSYDNGFYGLSVDSGLYYIRADTQYTDAFTVHCPVTDSFVARVHGTDTLIPGLNFGFECAPGYDLTVWSVGVAGDRARAGQSALVNINAGDLAKEYGVSCMHGIGGKVRIIKHTTLAQYAAFSSVHPYIISGDTLTWTIADFGTVDNENDFFPVLNIDPSAASGTPICIDVYITPAAGDNDSTNNHLSYCFYVNNSYDPNFKMVYPEGNLPNTGIWLTYTIHFQNTGNDTAYNVHINDTLDTRYLDLSTLQYLGASGRCYMAADINGAMRIDLPGIDLLDSAHHASRSQGWVQYKIKTKPNLSQNPVIKNTAYIFFDFNDPVQTNYTTNYICTANDTFVMQRFFCTGDSFHFGHQNLFAPGQYTDTGRSVWGCDSVTILHLSQRTVKRDTTHARICGGYSYYWHYRSYLTQGFFVDTTTASNGCDSISVLDLVVHPIHIDTTYVPACPGEQYVYYNGYQIPVGPGTFFGMVTGVDSFNCNTFMSYIPYLLPQPRDTVYQRICYGGSAFFAGHYYYYSGYYSDTLVAASVSGCDSIIVLALDQHNDYTSIVRYVCPGTPYYVYQGQAFSVPGDYYSHYPSISGCDSATELTIIIDPLYPLLSASSPACALPDTLIAHGVQSAVSIDWILNGAVVKSSFTDTAVTIVDSLTGIGGIAKIKTDPHGNIFALTWGPYAIIKYDSSGHIINTFLLGGYGYPSDFYIDTAGNIYVAVGNYGDVIRCARDSFSMGSFHVVASFGYNNMNRMAVDGAGNIYASVSSSDRVIKSTGLYNTTTVVAGGNGAGSAANQLTSPGGLYIDRSDNLYVVDQSSIGDRIQKFPPGSTSATNGITIAGGTLSPPGVIRPGEITGDSAGNIYEMDASNQVLKFPPGSTDGTPGIPFSPRSVCRYFYYFGTFALTSGHDILTATNYASNLDYSLHRSSITKWSTHGLDTGFITSSRGLCYAVAHGCSCGLNSDTLFPGYASRSTIDSTCQGDPYFLHGHALSRSGLYLDTLLSSVGCDTIVRLALNVKPAAPVHITPSGNICAGADTLSLSGATVDNVDWMRNGVSVHIDSLIGVTVAGGHDTGSAANQLYEPENIFLDSAGNIYTGDWFNYRVQKWAPGAAAGTTVAGGNGMGSAANQLSDPWGVYVDQNGNVYVSDGPNDRVQMWAPGSTAGITVAGGHGTGTGPDQFSYPGGIFLDRAGSLYVVDNGNNRVQKWLPNAVSGITVAGGNGGGNAANQLSRPSSLYVDTAGDIYIADLYNNRIQKWAKDSAYGITIAGGNGFGSSPNQISYPSGVYVDGTGAIYVSDDNNNRVQRFTPGSVNGITVAGGHGYGSAPNQMKGAAGVWLDQAGDIYVADIYNNRIQRWDPIKNYTISQPGDYSAIYVNPDGCSSITDTLHLVSGYTTSLHQMICAGSTLAFHTQTLSSPGIYYDTIITGSGCDSIIALTLSVDTAKTPVITASGNVLSAVVQGGVVYHWYRNNQLIASATSSQYTSQSAGSYTVSQTDTQNCTSLLSSAYVVLGVDEHVSDYSFIKLYPNPNNGIFTLESYDQKGNEYKIYNNIGQMIVRNRIVADRQEVNTTDLANGVYTFVCGGRVISFAIVK